MAEKRRKRKRHDRSHAARGASEPSVSGAESDEGGGGMLQGIRSGFRQAAGVEEGPPSKLGTILWVVVLVAAVALLAYRWYG